MNSSVVRKISPSDVRAMEVRRSLDVEVVHRISSRLGINAMTPGMHLSWYIHRFLTALQ